ncbi:MAG TPA: ATP-binding protein [Pseudonocardiaceae bacterium]
MAQRPGSAGEYAVPRAEAAPPLWLTVPARPGQLPGLRRALREWLAQAGVEEHDATAVQVAAGEATSNVVEHAYLGAEPELVRLTADVVTDAGGGRVLELRVIDSGSWRDDGPHTRDRGRGLPLMSATMDEVRVERHDGGPGTTVHMRLRLS